MLFALFFFMANLNNFIIQVLAPIQPFLDLVLPSLHQTLPQLIVLTISIVLYGIIIYKFYRFLAKRDVFALNVKKYYEAHRGLARTFFSTIFGVFKYCVIFPLVVFCWFAGFAFLLALLAKNLPLDQLLLVCISFVTAIRIISYYSEDLARDLAKLVPLALLAVALIEPNFFSLNILWERINSINQFATDILAYFLFIIMIEWLLRVALFIKLALFGVSKKSIEPEK